MTRSTASETCPSECDLSSYHQTVMPLKQGPGWFQNLPQSRGVQASISQEPVIQEVEYLGVIVGRGQVKIDPVKVKGIMD
jgi:hypothetical protein